jgi:hypothetical protein
MKLLLMGRLPTGEKVPLTLVKTKEGVYAIPVEVTKDDGPGAPHYDEVTVEIAEISSPGDTTRLLAATPPGTGGLDTAGHILELGYVERQNIG